MFYKKKVFVKLSQNSQENTCVEVSFLINVQAWGLQLYLKRDSDTVFSCEFCKTFKNKFFTEYLRVSDPFNLYSWFGDVASFFVQIFV